MAHFEVLKSIHVPILVLSECEIYVNVNLKVLERKLTDLDYS